VVLPLFAIFLSLSGSFLAGFIIGWGKPVPVDWNNLKNPRRDDTLIALAGPGMNLVLAFLCMGMIKVGVILKGSGSMEAGQMLVEIGRMLVQVNLILAFFNLLPIPPLDGSHVLWNALGLSWESYFRAMQYGFLMVIVAINIPGVRYALAVAVVESSKVLARLYGI
jgi:Zn-dependent protease